MTIDITFTESGEPSPLPKLPMRGELVFVCEISDLDARRIGDAMTGRCPLDADGYAALDALNDEAERSPLRRSDP